MMKQIKLKTAGRPLKYNELPARTLDYNLTVNGTITVTFWVTLVGYIL